MEQKIIEAIRTKLSYDPVTGNMYWVKAAGSHYKKKLGAIAGNLNTKGYLRIRLLGKSIYCHRAAWLLYYGEPPNGMIDHINGIPTDNRIENLRIANFSENNWNRYNKKEIGAFRVSGTTRFYAAIGHLGKRLYLGSFGTKEEAHAAYQAKARELRGEFHE